ncbi:MAG: hypothetical protein B6U73_00020 [Desulfurococcales archaeon ex4484_204]|nr:MAG: hypothetical protein B6U73_00020 [Desulfurococcales archaeon ex4484_204]
MVRGAWCRVTVLAVLAVAAVLTALAVSPVASSGTATATLKPIKVKILTPPSLPKGVSSETLTKALEIAKTNPEVRKLLEEGYKVKQAVPVARGKIVFKDGEAVFSNPEVVGVVLTLEKGSKEVFVTVDLISGKVLVGKESIVIHYHGSAEP